MVIIYDPQSSVVPLFLLNRRSDQVDVVIFGSGHFCFMIIDLRLLNILLFEGKTVCILLNIQVQ